MDLALSHPLPGTGVGIDDRLGSCPDPEYWQVSLEMRFDDGLL
ncbi:hypothetical protein [Micromonospora sp. ATA51]|nr:hypothetical protein [Micromonospora sp. ATA51]